MGACGSTNASPATPAELDVEGKQYAVKAINLYSEIDLSMAPNTEKKMSASAEVKHLTGNQSCIGFACRKGRKTGGRSPNQDSWHIYREPNKLSVYAVYDGHGEKGHLVSDYVKQALTKSVASAVKSRCGDATAKVQACYQRVQRNLASKPHLGVNMSGTTATVVVHDHEFDRLVCSHVGDSTAVILKQTTRTTRLVAEPLTRDHRPNHPDEQRRIEKHGRVVFDGYCHRVVKKHGSTPGLNMSRSLGDMVAHTACGVSELPEVLDRPLTSQDRALLVCSDGIWEVMTPQEAADIVQDFGPWQATEAAKKLADVAIGRWLAGTQGKHTDDATVVLAWLQGCPNSPTLSRAETCSTATPALECSEAMVATDSEVSSFGLLPRGESCAAGMGVQD